MLVRDIDGKTFWNALSDVISPRIKEPTAVDESALSNFRKTFQGRNLKKGTLILLTWIEPSKMLVITQNIKLYFHDIWRIGYLKTCNMSFCWTFWYLQVSISSDGFPSNIDAEIESVNVTSSLFDAFFGESPVSPTLKASVSNGLVAVLN